MRVSPSWSCKHENHGSSSASAASAAPPRERLPISPARERSSSGRPSHPKRDGPRTSASRATRSPSGVSTGRLDALRALDLQAPAVEVSDDIAGGVEHRRVLWPAVAVLEVAAVVGDEQEHATRCHRLGDRAHDRPPLVGRHLEIEDENEVESSGLGRVLEQIRDDPLALARRARWRARAAFSRPTSEKSTPVTCQPRSASQTALRPSPQATSSARPGAQRRCLRDEEPVSRARPDQLAAGVAPVPGSRCPSPQVHG